MCAIEDKMSSGELASALLRSLVALRQHRRHTPIARFSLLRTHILLTDNDLYRSSIFVNYLVDKFLSDIILSTI